MLNYVVRVGVQTRKMKLLLKLHCRVNVATSLAKPSIAVGREWLKQAESELAVQRHLFQSLDINHSFPHHICFLAHQVAEKSLKGAKFAVLGIGKDKSLRRHGLTILAEDLEKTRFFPRGSLSSLVINLEGMYLNTRYPNKYNPHRAPSEIYTSEQAGKAMVISETVYKRIESFFETLHTK